MIAALATFLWWHAAAQGVLYHLGLSLMVVCSVNTVLFNGNPLLRYDGYYVLADWLEVPNLRERCNTYLKHLVMEHCLGMEVPPEPVMALRRRILFVVYAVASYAYGWVVMLGVLWFVSRFLKPYKLGTVGLLLACASVASMVGWPLYRFLKSWHQRGRKLPEMKAERVSLSVVGLVALLLAFFLVPLPISRVRQTGLVQPRPEAAEKVFVTQAATLDVLHVLDGQQVRQGDILAEFRSLELETQREESRSQHAIRLVQLKALRQQAADSSDPAERARLEVTLTQADGERKVYAQQLGVLEKACQRLVLRAADGHRDGSTAARGRRQALGGRPGRALLQHRRPTPAPSAGAADAARLSFAQGGPRAEARPGRDDARAGVGRADLGRQGRTLTRERGPGRAPGPHAPLRRPPRRQARREAEHVCPAGAALPGGHRLPGGRGRRDLAGDARSGENPLSLAECGVVDLADSVFALRPGADGMSAGMFPMDTTAVLPVRPARPEGRGRLGPRWWNRLAALVGLPARRRLARAALVVPAVRHWEAEYGRLSDADLHRAGLRLRGRARGGEPLDRILAEAFGAVCVAARRRLALRPFDVQIAAGAVIHDGAIAELATGEGKTLVAVLPVFLNALTGKGPMSRRSMITLPDGMPNGPGRSTVALGLTIGVLQNAQEDAERTEAYRCDVTYGTAAEFGFDFLRDRLKHARGRPADPGCWRRGLPQGNRREGILGCSASTTSRWWTRPTTCSSMRPHAPGHCQLHSSGHTGGAGRLSLGRCRCPSPGARAAFRPRREETEGGADTGGQAEAALVGTAAGPDVPAMDKLREHVERALHAHHRFRRDQHYLVAEDKVEIVDEATGRRMPDRHWGEGLHQAVEAKEGVTITLPSDHAAQVTFQSYFRHYEKLAGMTGTAAQDRRELQRVYQLRVVCVPTNRPVRRQQWPDRIFPTEEAKFDAVVADVQRLHALGRPVLIGTRSVEKSEDLSRRFQEVGIEHQVLNARYHEQEGQIVAQAGQPGRVTIATNMAGRGTDIKLGPGVAEAGGLHVLGTERHESLRIDRQLAGRAGRQGDPGSCQFFLALDDELLEGLGVAARRCSVSWAMSDASSAGIATVRFLGPPSGGGNGAITDNASNCSSTRSSARKSWKTSGPTLLWTECRQERLRELFLQCLTAPVPFPPGR